MNLSGRQLDRIRAFHAKHGCAWAVIENAGYEGENWTGGLYATPAGAIVALREAYEPDERETLHPDVAHWDSVEEFWSYDH